MSDTILKTLDRKLKEIKDRTKPFGGFTIIFAGDFRQLEPVGANDTELLSQAYQASIGNTALML